jgi:hypothetical protein
MEKLKKRKGLLNERSLSGNNLSAACYPNYNITQEERKRDLVRETANSIGWFLMPLLLVKYRF